MEEQKATTGSKFKNFFRKSESTDAKSGGWMQKLKAMGWIAFLFFFVKGLVWLAIFFGLGKVFFS